MDHEEIKNRYMQLFHRLHRIRFDSFFRNISQSEFIHLQKIHCFSSEHPEAEGIYVSEIAAQLRISSPAVSRTLRPLEAKGLIERFPDKNDRRNTFIRLTDKGEKTREEFFSGIGEYFNDVFARMGAEDMDHLLDLWERLCWIMEDEMQRKNAGVRHIQDKTTIDKTERRR